MQITYKAGLLPPKNFILFVSIKSPLKIMTNTFYFRVKVLFVLNSFKFCLDFLFMHKKRLDLKFMTSQPGQKTITTHILSNISQRKENQTMKFGQLIEYNKINVLLQKSCRN